MTTLKHDDGCDIFAGERCSCSTSSGFEDLLRESMRGLFQVKPPRLEVAKDTTKTLEQVRVAHVQTQIFDLIGIVKRSGPESPWLGEKISDARVVCIQDYIGGPLAYVEVTRERFWETAAKRTAWQLEKLQATEKKTP